jgi:MFS family permease
VVALGIGRFVYTPILPFMIQSLHLSTSRAGLLASTNLLGYLLGGIATTKAALPGSKRLWILSGVAVNAAATLGMGFTSSIFWFSVSRFVGGAATAIVSVYGPALVMDIPAELGRRKFVSFYYTAPGWGIAGSALLVAGLAALGMDWKGLWISMGLISVLGLVLMQWIMPPTPASTAPVASVAATQWDRKLAKLVIAYGLCAFGYVITATFISQISRTDPALRPAEPYVWFLVGAFAIPSISCWTRLGERLGYGRTWALSMIVQGAGVMAAVIAASPIWILVAAALLGVTINAVGALSIFRVRELIPGDLRPFMATLVVASGLGQIIGPILAGAISDLTGNFFLPSLIATAALLVSSALAVAPRPRMTVAGVASDEAS